MSEFTLYIERDIPIEASNDREAGLLAKRLHDAIEAALETAAPGAQCLYARSTCHRGRSNKIIYDEERQPDPEDPHYYVPARKPRTPADKWEC